MKKFYFLFAIFSFLILYADQEIIDSYVTYKVDFGKDVVKLYWKDSNDIPYEKLENLAKTKPNGFNFIMNGGIYTEGMKPEGLYIENSKELSPLNLKDGKGNFYEKPNGVFYIQKNKPYIVTSDKFKSNDKITYAVQSGPMLITDGTINPKFTDKSNSRHIRNGVCLTKNNNLILIVSNEKVTLYDFAIYSKANYKCHNLLYMDGTISRAYEYNKINSSQKYPFVTMIAVEPKK